MNIGERIRERRIALGMSQEELAYKVGYKSRASINKLELSRTLPISKVSVMAKALNISEAELMGFPDSAPLTSDYTIIATRLAHTDLSESDVEEIANTFNLTVEQFNVWEARYKQIKRLLPYFEKLSDLTPEHENQILEFIDMFYEKDKKED